MFDPGFWEMVVIAVLALLILGPERLPVVARKVGFWVGRARRYIASVRSDIEREFRTDELERMLSEQSSEIKELRDMLTSQKNQVVGAVKETEYLLKARAETPDEPEKADGKPAPGKESGKE